MREWIKRSCVAILCASPALVLAEMEPEIDAGGAFSHYQTFIQTRETGVYEWNGMLFVQVKLPLNDKKRSQARAKMEAILVADKLVRQWAIDHTASYRNKGNKGNIPEGISLAQNISTKFAPEWIFRDWTIRTAIREFPHQVKDGYYILGQVFDRDKLFKSIPATFLVPLPEVNWCESLPTIVRKEISGNMQSVFLYECGAPDLIVLSNNTNGVDFATTAWGKEFLDVDRSISSFLSDSVFARKLKERVKRITGPHIVTNWAETSSAPIVTKDLYVSVVTNPPLTRVVATNHYNRAQTKSEVERWGGSNGAEVQEMSLESEEAQIVSKITRTTIETINVVRRRKVCVSIGDAKFEKIFLSAGKMPCRPATQNAAGRRAVSVYTGPTDLVEKEHALENALSENPGDKELWNLYGRCLMTHGETMGAIICFRQAIRLDEKYEFALANLADAYMSLGYKRLAFGTAIVARGLARSEWCIKRTEAILMGK